MPNPQPSDPHALLALNLVHTHAPSSTADARITTDGIVREIRTLSRLEVAPDRVEHAVMSRWLMGPGPYDQRLLIRQRLPGGPKREAWVRDPYAGRPRRWPIVTWQPFDGTALRWMDMLIPPPGTFDARLREPSPAPSDPAWQPPEPCVVVELVLAPQFWGPEPRIVRLWLAARPDRVIDHRVELHLSDGRVRAVVASDWKRLTNSVWVPATRTIDDPELGMRSVVQVTRCLPDPLSADMFTPTYMAERDW